MIKKGIFPFEQHFDLFNGLDVLQNTFSEVVCLYSCQYSNDSYSDYDWIIAAGSHRTLNLNQTEKAFEKLRKFVSEADLPVFGILSYELKNTLEYVELRQHQAERFPVLAFFEPLILMQKRKDVNEVEVFSRHLLSPEDVFWLFIKEIKTFIPKTSIPAELQCNFSFEAYKTVFEHIQNHIVNGDIYEMNFCIKFSGKTADFEGLQYFNALCDSAAAPFSAWLKFDGNQLVSSSPERFLKHENGNLLSQPIKGTRKRATDLKADRELKMELRHDAKEQAENVMIVDLVRNDLAKVSIPGSVDVTELFGVYTFKQVHQMISSVRSRMNTDKYDWCDALQAAFPMGSMTGAPKKRAVELIDTYEKNKREWYSGALGYIEPNGNFDFNVVIRSLLYHAGSQEVSFQVGSAITYDAKAQQEWEECLLKGENLKKLF